MRNDTHFHSFIPEEIKVMFYIHTNKNIFIDFLKYYFTDFLWGMSLTFALNAVAYSHKKKSIIIKSIITFFVGLLFELAQLFGVINGTFDIADIIMYALAAIITAVININIFKE